MLNSNKEGMDFLRKGQYKQAFEQLKYAEAVVVSKQTEEETNLMSVTCNNLGCYYKKDPLFSSFSTCFIRFFDLFHMSS